MGKQGHIWNRRFWVWINTPEMHEGWFVQKQLRAYHGGSYANSCGSAFFILLMACVCVGQGLDWPAAVGLLAFAISAVARHLRSLRHDRDGGEHDVAAELRWIVSHSAVAGVAVAIASMSALIEPLGDMPGIAALVIVAIMLSGSWSIDVIPRAALALLLSVSAGSIAAFLLLGTTEAIAAAAIVAAFTILFVAHCMFSFNSFAVRLLRARELAGAADTVQLLLNDFEEHGADWLWETGSQGHITSPSARFAEVAGQSAGALSQVRFIDLFDPGHERAILERLFANRQPFRDVVARRTRDGEEHWWSVTGRPTLNDAGAATGMRGVATDVSAAKRAEAKIAYMAHYDGLTDLPNRRLFHDTLARALSRRREEALAVFYLDIDHFKTINDSLGHTIGDEVLKVAAQRIESCLGPQDMVARLGGDEFAVLMANARSQADVWRVANAIVAAIGEAMFIERHEILAGLSIGMAFAPDHGNNADTLIKNADLALYHAKQNGRGRAAMFEIDMHEALQARRMIEMDLRAALGRDQLELYYQPLINLQSGDITSYEALLRWNHPAQGLIMPAIFIPIAEETGHIVQLGEWVIRTALLEVARWPAHISVSVNLSPVQMRSTNLVPTIVNALAASGVDAGRLELEITETVLMHDTEANLAVLHQLRALGVRIALDDFGTGYSSLNYLRSFPFDKIKIDRCFVDEVDSCEDSRAIVRAVTSLAANLGMVTTAEGVEREDQLAELRREGCTEVQGYLLSRPMPVDQIAGRAAVGAPAACPVVQIEAGHPAETGHRRRANRRKAA